MRQARGSAVWRLSGPEGESEAPFEGEVSFRSLPPDAAGIPAPIKDLAADHPLLALVRLRVHASETSLQSPSGVKLALRTERFTAAPPSQGWPKGAEPQSLLAVRLLEGNPDGFLHLATYLRDRLGLPASAGDPCHAALQGLGLPEPGAPVPAPLRVRSEDPLALAARKVVGQQALKMRANVTGTLEDLDPEYLHDLRVATRRLRSALRLFAEVLGPKRCDSLRLELSWIGGLLGVLRDLDVFRLNLQEQSQRLGEGGAIAGLLAEELGRQRGPMREALTAALASRRFLALMGRLEVLASSPSPRRPRGRQGVPVARGAPVLIRKAQKRVLKLGRTIGPDSLAADLHRLRILFKRFRYACEFFQEAFVDPALGEDPLADYIQAMVRFQDCLGEHQDAIVATARIQELAKNMVRRGGLAAERLLDLGALIQVQREIARERRGRLAKLWARFDKRSVRQWLGGVEGRARQGSRTGETSPTTPA
ncbi:MAG TPA: CHAD domain-containing protein [Candidatus Methylomirabilis sp.]|nr:CHAD domain-containing protein [Candidatus Methylomirabilis sp.]